jgi:hypothetical protein
LFIPDPDPDFLSKPDPGVKKAPDPRSGSATLVMIQYLEQIILGLASTLQIQHLEAQCTSFGKEKYVLV